MLHHILDRSDLLAHARLWGPHYQLHGQTHPSGMLQGVFRTHDWGNGLSLHCSDVLNLQDLHSEVVAEAGLGFTLLLEGDVALRYGSAECADHTPRRGEATLLQLQQPERLIRQARRGIRVRKVHLGMSADWLHTHDLLRHTALPVQHLQTRRWRPSARLHALADAVLDSRLGNAGLALLQLESLSLAMAHEVLQAPPADRALPPRVQQRMSQLRDYLHALPVDTTPSLQQLASQFATSAASLQRHFMQAFGCSVLHYLRQNRLQQARDHLLDGGTIQQAAALAGYAQSGNFATAYRRCFGEAPSQTRP
ncbi:helix-turn-helix transcriptional regulator [Leeia aquatica]|uniref:Helix-turn-helix transcriptional regulator n=1 Tax=Leeia aquatica TaxID=2725557 RepID=A0A847SAG8_9NEIS|nr:helix-turn-helix transcriptional regulator [Leeia aquatica]NLR76723.1 helix-turn-helix transcriptional regulator [Leeia aquatica]